MNIRTKKIVTYAVSFILLASVAFYFSMEDYQKENMAQFISQTFSSTGQ